MYDGGDAAPPSPPKAPQSGSLTDWTTVKSGNAFEGEDGLESSVAAEASLKDHLEDQLSIAALLPEDRMILLALIDAVDEAGYLRADLMDIAERLGCEIEDVAGRAGRAAGFRSRRRGRPRPVRMPVAAAEGHRTGSIRPWRRC